MYLMLMNASSPPQRSNASNVSSMRSPRFSRSRWLYSMPSPRFTVTTTSSRRTKIHTSRKVMTLFYRPAWNQGGICRGKPGNFPVTRSDLPPHWFVWKLPCQGKNDSRHCWNSTELCQLSVDYSPLSKDARSISVQFSQLWLLIEIIRCILAVFLHFTRGNNNGSLHWIVEGLYVYCLSTSWRPLIWSITVCCYISSLTGKCHTGSLNGSFLIESKGHNEYEVFTKSLAVLDTITEVHCHTT